MSGELLSSWLVRIARSHAVKLHSFCRVAFGRDRPIWNRDIDKCGDPVLERILAVKTATPTSIVSGCLLRSYEGVLYETHNAYGHTLLLNALGVYHRVHRNFGLQFCPECLAELPTYFRKKWRVGIVVYCPVHHRLLHDCCPRCRAPINFHRGELGQKATAKSPPMYRCPRCRADLRSISAIKLAPQLGATLEELSVRHEKFIRDGFALLPSGDPVYSHLYFAVIRHMMLLFGRRTNLDGLVHAAASELGFNVDVFRRRRLVETERTTVRAAALATAEWFFRDWPQRSMALCHKFHVCAWVLLDNFDPCPYWFSSEIRSRLYTVYAPWRKTWNVGKTEFHSYNEFGHTRMRSR